MMELLGFEILTNGAMDVTLGIIAILMSLSMFLQPLPTILKIICTKEVGEVLPHSYVFAAVNCYLWFVYEFKQTEEPMQFRDFCIFYTCGFGSMMECLYLAVFWTCMEDVSRFKLVSFGYCAFCLHIMFINKSWWSALVMGEKHYLLGLMVTLSGIMMYASPLMTILHVYHTRHVECLPFRLLITSCLYGFAWMIYACLPSKFDLCLATTHGIGILAVIVQLGVAYKVRNSIAACHTGAIAEQCRGSRNDPGELEEQLMIA